MQQWVRFSAKVAAGFLSVWFLLLPVTANALGLGNIKMDSALNEPLKAEIELLSATKEDVKGLEVRLASREAFLRAGVDRSVLLSRIKFNVVKHGSKYFVVLTTPQPIREPFLNFLVELNWKNGRMLREYTVLLDPADRMQQQRVAQAPETTPPVSAPVPTPAPTSAAAEAQPEPMPAPTSPFMAEPESPAPAPAPAETAKTEKAPLMPAVPLDQAPQVPAKAEAEAPAPEPAPAPAPMAAAPEPEPAPVPAPTPEPIAQAEAPTPAPEQPFEGEQQDDGGLFPEIPLTAYKESRAEAPTPAGEEAAAPEPAGELDYGITKKGDNLWRIAEKLKPNNQVTVYQVMMALQQSNPKAFVEGNIHRLKVGQVMRIEDPSLLTAMSKTQALQQYEQQTTAWQGYLAQTGRNVPRQAIEAGEQAPAPAEPSVTSGELTLSTPQSEKMTAGSGGEEGAASSEDAALLEQQARKAMEEAKAQKQKNTALSARLDELDAELKRMENLVTIKDSDLANLQRKLDQLNAQRAAAKESMPAPEETAKPEATTPAEPVAPPPMESAPTEVAKAEPEEPAKPAAEAAPEPVAPTPAPEAQPSAPAAPPVAAPAPAPQPTTAPGKQGGGIMGMIKGFFGGVMGGLNAMMLIIGGVVVVVILLIIFIIVRRRKGVSFQESILTGGGDADSVSMDASPSQGSSLMGGESSFLSDFAISGVSAIQAEDSEVDPLTEADVFMAYGRYEAAEERLQEAITQDPNRGELRVKLLELFNTTKNEQAFESAAEDYYASLSGNVAGNPLWQKVVAMGKELVPANPLFTGGVVSTTKAEPAPAPEMPNLSDNQDVMDIGLDTGVFNTSDFSTDAFNEAPKQAPATTDNDLDFNLDMGQAAEVENVAEQGEDSVLDFSMEAPSDAAAASDELDFSLDTKSDDLESGLDFNLDTGDEPTAETQAPATRDDMDFNLDMAGDEEPTATEIKLGMDDEKPDTSLDFDFGQDLDSELAGGTDMNLDASDASISLDTSGGGDEVGTKLDLARAYIDMGDPDGARSILDEVMEEGNDGQKQEAQQLMTQIG